MKYEGARGITEPRITALQIAAPQQRRPRVTRAFARVLLSIGWSLVAGSLGARGQATVEARIETTLPTWSTNRPGLALDGKRDTYFQSRRPPDTADQFTVIFSHPIYARRIEVETGDDAGADALGAGTLEVAPDLSHFKKAAEFLSGFATAAVAPQPVKALRIHPGKNQKDWLVIREIVFDPPLRILKATQGLCVTVDTSQTPDLAEWGRQARELCMAWQPQIAKLLPSKGFEPPLSIRLVLVERLTGGVGVTVDTDIRLLAPHFRDQPADTGVVIHELAHVVQAYAASVAENQGPLPPVWLTEGIADYIRYYRYEGRAPPNRIDPLTGSYTDSYQTTAVFLNWIEQARARDFVKKVNADIRLGKYRESLFKQYAGKTLDQLWAEFAISLAR
jgi:hypothetical protein